MRPQSVFQVDLFEAHLIGGSRPEDRPKRTPSSTQRLLARAAHAGENVGRVARAIQEVGDARGLRQILGVISLVRKFVYASNEPRLSRAARSWSVEGG